MTYKIVMKDSDLVILDRLTLCEARTALKDCGDGFEIRNENDKVIGERKSSNGCKVH